MKEDFYRTVKDSGLMNIVSGCFALAVGISSLICGVRLMKSSGKILF